MCFAFIYKLMYAMVIICIEGVQEKCASHPISSQSHTPKTTIVSVLFTFITRGFKEKAREL